MVPAPFTTVALSTTSPFSFNKSTARTSSTGRHSIRVLSAATTITTRQHSSFSLLSRSKLSRRTFSKMEELHFPHCTLLPEQRRRWKPDFVNFMVHPPRFHKTKTAALVHASFQVLEDLHFDLDGVAHGESSFGVPAYGSVLEHEVSSGA